MADKPYFDERVRGKIRAEIVLDQNKKPVSLPGANLNHYKLRLYVETNNPAVQSVTYKLDPTYYDPVRESTDPSKQFLIELTTYGDYPVTVDAQVGGEIVRKVVPLSQLLQETYENSTDPEILNVLNEIRSH